MKNRVKFAELLAAYRERCGWSQDTLGMKLGNVHRNTIATWESGTIPSRDKVFRLVDELQLFKEERREFLNVAGFSIEHWPADYWNVPYPHNPYFIGREAFLKSLKQRLVSGEKITALPQAISGLGGIGKTQVAIEYAHRYGDQYEAVLWIQADSLEVATAACLQLAIQVLGLPEQQEAERQIIQVRRWLQKRHGWLLIFDNVEDLQAIISTFVPSRHQGSVLITTRRHDAEALVQNEMLPLLAEDDAVLFLLRRASSIARKASATEANPDDTALAKDLCQLLDRLPLALDQAGAYIAENGGSLQSYIDLYHKYRPILLDRRNAKDQPSHHNESDHPDSVLMTFWLSMEQIQQRNTFAGRVLQFCAFLAPDQIPEKLVIAGLTDMETEGSNALEMGEALGLLHRYSLIERTEQILSLHRLVQEVIQEVLSIKERHLWMGLAVLVVNAFFPSGEYGTWAQCEFLLPHAITCTKWTLILKQNKLEGAQLLSHTGRYLYERALYREAETFWKLALTISEGQLGVSHPYTANCLSNLAVSYRKQGRYAEAEPLYQHALIIAEEQLGASHPNTANYLTHLAELYRAQDRNEEAGPLYQRAVQLTLALLGIEHPKTQQLMNNYLKLLSDIYTNGNIDDLIKLFYAKQQIINDDGILQD